MTRKRCSREANKTIFFLLVSGAVNCGLSINSDAQTPPRKPRTEESESAGRTSPRIYEDDEVKVQIPLDWMIATGDHPAVAPYISQAKSRLLLLAKNGYTLALSYHTEQVSGIIGGKLIEVLRIPWLSVNEAWDCTLHLGSYPQPAGRTLMFINIFFPTGDPEVRNKCGIKKALSYWTNKGGTRQIVGEQRWFAGTFTTADGDLFFESDGTNCGKKAYTLTSKAKTPEELPLVGDPDLKKTVTEAIDIVDSIHYKRCAPAVRQ
jgi:hypothetical protein